MEAAARLHSLHVQLAGSESTSEPPECMMAWGVREASPQPAREPACSAQPSPVGSSSLRGSFSRSVSPFVPDFAPERVLIVKAHPARLATQSEQFANELTQHLGICAPACRILRKLVCPSRQQSAFRRAMGVVTCHMATGMMRVRALQW